MLTLPTFAQSATVCTLRQILKHLPPKSAAIPSATHQRVGLGTFGGVYTPSLLTILGVIMYLAKNSKVPGEMCVIPLDSYSLGRCPAP